MLRRWTEVAVECGRPAPLGDGLSRRRPEDASHDIDSEFQETFHD